MVISENWLKGVIRESLYKHLFEQGGVDKYGNPIPKFGQGWGEDDSLMNRQGYNSDGSKGPWFSRSVAVATAVLLHDTESKKWYVLANQRGNGTPDYQGYWNLPCGYLDYNEDTAKAASREVYEETGIQISPAKLQNMGYSADPKQNRQNVCCFFATVLNGKVSDYPFNKDNMEEGEVDGIQWVELKYVKNVKWAFDHDELLEKIINRLGYDMSDGGEEESTQDATIYIERAINMIDRGEPVEKIKDMLENALWKITGRNRSQE